MKNKIKIQLFNIQFRWRVFENFHKEKMFLN